MDNPKIKVTFKKQPSETGLRSVGSGTPCTDIFFNDVYVGNICLTDSWHHSKLECFVYIQHKKQDKDDNPNCDWFNAKYKMSSLDVVSAKKQVRENKFVLFSRMTKSLQDEIRANA